MGQVMATPGRGAARQQGPTDRRGAAGRTFSTRSSTRRIDLAGAVKVPGFRKGKVPTQVLEARIGRERIFTEAVESHIGGWFLNAAASDAHPPGRGA